jgi:hypothetical protein
MRLDPHLALPDRQQPVPQCSSLGESTAQVRCPQHGIVDVQGGPVRMEPTAWLPLDGVPAEIVESPGTARGSP